MLQGTRPARVGRSIQATLGRILTQGCLKDPRVANAGLISVTEVRVSPDLKNARVFVSIYADKQVQEEALQGLRRAAGFLRGEVGRELGIKFFPQLDFRLDPTMEQSAHIDQVLDEIKEES